MPLLMRYSAIEMITIVVSIYYIHTHVDIPTYDIATHVQTECMKAGGCISFFSFYCCIL